MDSIEVVTIKPDINEEQTELLGQEVNTSKLTEEPNLVIVLNKSNLVTASQPIEEHEIKVLDDGESTGGEGHVMIRDEPIGQHQGIATSITTSTQNSPDQLNDLQSYLVTFNKEIGHGGQSTAFSFGDLNSSSITSSVRPVIYADGQLLNVSSSLQCNQDLQNLSDNTKVEISMTSDNLDPQSQTLRIAEALSDNGALLQQNSQVVSQDELSPLTNDHQRTVMLQGLPGAPGTLVQVNMPGTPRNKVMPVVSLDGKEPMHLSLDSNVIPQIINVSQPSDTLPGGVVVVKNESDATLSSPAGVGELEGVQVGQADITNAQLIALQNTDTNTQLVTVNNPQELQMIGNSEGGDSSNANFQTVSIVPTSSEQGSEMNYVLIVSQPDPDKEGGSPKQFALDMGMLQPVFDFKEGRDSVEEIVDEDGTTRRIIRVNAKKLETTQLQCHYCSYTAPKRYLMMRHMKTHSEDRPFQCNLCEKSFKTHASLQNHVNTHTGVRPHKCKDCEMAFTTSGELVRHIRYKHTFEKPHKCTECDYASVELSKLKRHMRSHTGERPYQCPHCPYASPDTYKLKRHLRIHTGEKPYECDVCHARFTQSNSLKAHKLIHSGMKPVFQCELCPTTCGRKTDLKIHMMKLHSNDKPVECKKCGMCFSDRYSFKLHLKTHDGEKCFKCDQCDYAALSQRHLESHLLTHTGEKPYECDECEQTFRQKQLLKRHKNLYHTPDYNKPEPKEKNFECTLCDKQFANRGNLLRHMQNHDPEYWNKRLSEGSSNSMSTDELIQGSLLSDMREGKLGVAPKVVIVHPNGNVEEVTSRLQNLVAEKQMEEMMVQVVQEGSAPANVSHSLEEAIRNQVEAVMHSQAQTIKVIEAGKTSSGDDSAADGLTIDIERPVPAVLSHPKQTYSRQEIESGETGSLSQSSWDSDPVDKLHDHVIIVKPRDKRNEENGDEGKMEQAGIIDDHSSDETNLDICADLTDNQLEQEMETDS